MTTNEKMNNLNDYFNFRGGNISTMIDTKNYTEYEKDNSKDTILLNGGVKTYLTDDESNLPSKCDYLIIHKQSATTTYIECDDRLKYRIGNNCIIISSKPTNKRLLLKFIHHWFRTFPILKNIQRGSVQPTITIKSVKELQTFIIN